jgi:hypothetical protein
MLPSVKGRAGGLSFSCRFDDALDCGVATGSDAAKGYFDRESIKLFAIIAIAQFTDFGIVRILGISAHLHPSTSLEHTRNCALLA